MARAHYLMFSDHSKECWNFFPLLIRSVSTARWNNINNDNNTSALNESREKQPIMIVDEHLKGFGRIIDERREFYSKLNWMENFPHSNRLSFTHLTAPSTLNTTNAVHYASFNIEIHSYLASTKSRKFWEFALFCCNYSDNIFSTILSPHQLLLNRFND